MAIFNILGSCICRDIFALNPGNSHSVQHYLNFISPNAVFLFKNKPKRLLTEEDMKEVKASNFGKRCLIKDYNKEVLDYYQEQSDFFVLDLIFMVHTLLIEEMYDNGDTHVFTYSQNFMDIMEKGLKNSFISQNKYKLINPIDLINRLGYKNVIDTYMRWLVEEKGYCEEQIIVVENKNAQYYTDGRMICSFNNDFSEQNKMLDDIYKYIEDVYPKCHMIKMPYGVCSEKNHHFGLTELHYNLEYYEYLYKCIDLITIKEKCELELLRLRDEYSDFFLKNMMSLMKQNFLLFCGENLLAGHLKEDVMDGFIAEKGTTYYNKVYFEPDQRAGILEKVYSAEPFGQRVAKVTRRENVIYISQKCCKRGFVGDGKQFGGKWMLINPSTVVETLSDSIIIRHNEDNSKYQTNIIQTIENSGRLAGKPITFSVYARVLKTNSEGKGGTIAVINSDNYNKGNFLAAKSFTNTEWERIFITVILPELPQFNGVTVCLRSVVSKKADGAIVEYKFPKLEIGTFPTALQDTFA